MLFITCLINHPQTTGIVSELFPAVPVHGNGLQISTWIRSELVVLTQRLKKQRSFSLLQHIYFTKAKNCLFFSSLIQNNKSYLGVFSFFFFAVRFIMGKTREGEAMPSLGKSCCFECIHVLGYRDWGDVLAVALGATCPPHRAGQDAPQGCEAGFSHSKVTSPCHQPLPSGNTALGRNPLQQQPGAGFGSTPALRRMLAGSAGRMLGATADAQVTFHTDFPATQIVHEM